MRQHGVKLAPNIKPALLADHPHYEHCAREGFFITGADGKPMIAYFWDALGSYIDFTNPRAAEWWKAHVKSALLDVGMAATWNDNNECELKDPTARAEFLRQAARGGRGEAGAEFADAQSVARGAACACAATSGPIW